MTPAQQKEHILNRTGCGHSTWASDRYDALGPTGYIAEQLAQTLPEYPVVTSLVTDGSLVSYKTLRLLLDQRQLEAVLADFWFNHFNVQALNVGYYVNLVIFPNVLGKFSDLLIATAQSAHMATFLDNKMNRAPREIAPGQFIGSHNENYARELLELHTVGVNGGYTDSDVANVALLMSGWRSAGVPFNPVFVAEFHDTDAKTVMGEFYPPGGGMEEGIALLNFLAMHPATINHISYKLCTRFIGDDPPASSVAAAASTWLATNGDLAAVTATILSDPAFTNPSPAHFRRKAKPPHRFVASAMAGMGKEGTLGPQGGINPAIFEMIKVAGDSAYSFPSPKGYSEHASYWISSNSMIIRFQMAEQLAKDSIDQLIDRTGVDGADLDTAFDAYEAAIMPGGVSATTRAAVLDHAAANATTNRQRAIAIVHMLLASPEFLRY